jgi:penicillin-binding protein 1A
MNQIFLGHRAYGFAAACRTYFGKPLSEITAAEAAMLAGIPKAPSRFNPISNFKRAKERQAYVLGRMKALGYLTDAEYKRAMAQPIEVKSAAGTPAGTYSIHADYPAELARRLLYNVYQDNIYSRGFDIYTTINSKDQEAAYHSVRSGILDYTRRSRYPGPAADIDLPAGVENSPTQLDSILDDLQDKYPDSGGLLTGVVLSASPTKVVVARSSQEIVDVDNKDALRVIARALKKNAAPKEKIERGSVVYLHKYDNHWEIINMPTVEAAFVAVRPQDGAILALVGGFDYNTDKFDRVTQAWRQPGSSIKPFIYASSLERGLTPATQISDEPFFLTAAQTGSKPWAPKNYGNHYEPMLTMRQGLYKSENMVAIRIMQAVTPKYAQEYLTRFGFDKSRQPAVLPMAIGAGTVTPLQMAGAYSVFANGGYRVPPYLIDHVTDSSGRVIMQAKPVVAGDAAARAIDPRTCYVMDDLLRGVATYGTGAKAHQVLKRNDIGGKTGTTNDSRDAWFAGFTPKLVGIAWMGYDQPKSLGVGETGGGAALPIWLNFMQVALKGQPETPPAPMPTGLSKIDGDYYFDEFPPGKAVARVGLPSPTDQLPGGVPGTGSTDGIGALLNQLGSSNNNAQPAPASSNNNGAQPLPVHF